MYYDAQETRRIFRPSGDIGGWLAFIAVRLVLGSISGTLTLFNLLLRVIPLLGEPFLMERIGEGPLLLLVGSVVMYIVSLAFLILTAVSLFQKKKQFLPLYVLYAGLSLFSFFFSGNAVFFCIVSILESINIAYLLTSRRTAVRFGFYNRFNRAALKAYAAKNDVGDRAEEILREIEQTANEYRSCKISHGAYDRRIHELLDLL